MVVSPERYNASLLLDANLEAGRADKVAILAAAGEVTYGELHRRACGYGGALRELGVRRGERVVLVLDDTPAVPTLILGAIRAGIVPVPVNPFHTGDEYAYFARDSEASLVVTEAARAETVVASLGESFDRSRVLSVDETPVVGRLDDAVATQPGELSPADTGRDDAAFWLYSSGSTGRPKGVVHRQHDILYTCETYARHVLDIREEDVTFSTTKLFHAYGLGNNLSFPYWAGATTVLLWGRPAPESVFETIDGYGPTLFFSVPTLYNALLNVADAPTSLPPSVRLCISAAEPLPAEVWHRWHDRYGLVILDGIGSTEMLHIYCSNREDDCVAGSSGRPVPGYELKLVDDKGSEILGAGIGDLYVRGDSALAEYWQQPEKTADSLRDGWFYSRDRYRRDAEGRYWYEGRADDMFKVSGLWVSPADVEGRLIEHPAVLESAVVGAAVDGFVKAKAFVVLRAGVEPDEALEAELREFCARKLHRYELPAQFSFVDELPKTITGKIQRYKLRESG